MVLQSRAKLQIQPERRAYPATRSQLLSYRYHHFGMIRLRRRFIWYDAFPAYMIGRECKPTGNDDDAPVATRVQRRK